MLLAMSAAVRPITLPASSMAPVAASTTGVSRANSSDHCNMAASAAVAPGWVADSVCKYSTYSRNAARLVSCAVLTPTSPSAAFICWRSVAARSSSV